MLELEALAGEMDPVELPRQPPNKLELIISMLELEVPTEELEPVRPPRNAAHHCGQACW
jgi:hypothetical protein